MDVFKVIMDHPYMVLGVFAALGGVLNRVLTGGNILTAAKSALTTVSVTSLVIVALILTRPTDRRWLPAGQTVKGIDLSRSKLPGVLTDPVQRTADQLVDAQLKMEAVFSAVQTAGRYILIAVVAGVLSWLLSKIVRRLESARQKRVQISHEVRLRAVEEQLGIRAAQ